MSAGDEAPMYGLHGPLSNLGGGTFTGNILTAILYGCITIQVGRYFSIFPNDSWSTKSLVVFLWAIEGFQLGCMTQALWHWFVDDFGNILSLIIATWEFAMYQVVSVTASMACQTFFAYRVYTLSHKIWFGMAVEAFALVQAGFGIAVAIRANQTLVFPEFVAEYTWLVLAWLGCQACADVVITLTMCLLLRMHKTGFKKTDNVINLMVLWTVNTGLITALLSLVILVTFAKAGFHYIVLAIGLPLGGFYTFTLLANLHSRVSISQKWTESQNTPLSWQMSDLTNNDGKRSRMVGNTLDQAASNIVSALGRGGGGGRSVAELSSYQLGGGIIENRGSIINVKVGFEDEKTEEGEYRNSFDKTSPTKKGVVVGIVQQHEIIDEDGIAYPNYDHTPDSKSAFDGYEFPPKDPYASENDKGTHITSITFAPMPNVLSLSRTQSGASPDDIDGDEPSPSTSQSSPRSGARSEPRVGSGRPGSRSKGYNMFGGRQLSFS